MPLRAPASFHPPRRRGRAPARPALRRRAARRADCLRPAPRTGRAGKLPRPARSGGGAALDGGNAKSGRRNGVGATSSRASGASPFRGGLQRVDAEIERRPTRERLPSATQSSPKAAGKCGAIHSGMSARTWSGASRDRRRGPGIAPPGAARARDDPPRSSRSGRRDRPQPNRAAPRQDAKGYPRPCARQSSAPPKRVIDEIADRRAVAGPGEAMARPQSLSASARAGGAAPCPPAPRSRRPSGRFVQNCRKFIVASPCDQKAAALTRDRHPPAG